MIGVMRDAPWPLRRLEDVCDVNPRLPDRQNLSPDSLVSFVPMAAIDEMHGQITGAELRRYAEVAKGYTAFRDGDVLFARITPCMENGKIAVATGLQHAVGFGSTEFHVLRPKPGILGEFVHYFLRRPEFRHAAKAAFTGTAGQQRVPAEFIRGARILAPPLSEQRRIVDILNHAASIRRLREQARAKAREIIPALFVEMFGDPATNPKGWARVNVGEITDIQGGLQLSRARAFLPLELPYLRVANVHRNRLDLAEIKSIRLTENEKRRVLLQAGDLLVVEGHGNPAEIGRVAVWDGSIAECVHQNHLIRARCRRGIVVPEYLCGFLNSRAGRQELLRQGKTTSGLNTISVSNIKRVQVLLPPVALQTDFAMRAAEIESVAALHEKAAATAEQLSQSLLSRAFATGRSAAYGAGEQDRRSDLSLAG